MTSPFNVRTPELVAFVAIQAEYRDLIWNIAMEESLSGYQRIDDLPELSDEDYQLVRRAKPELAQRLRSDLLRQVFADVQTECDSRAERAWERQQEDYHDGGRPTPAERTRQDLENAWRGLK